MHMRLPCPWYMHLPMPRAHGHATRTRPCYMHLPAGSWRRKRNYVLGATTHIRPSSLAPLNAPPTSAPGRCASAGCSYYAHSALSVGGGLHCCKRCQGHPGKHGTACERVEHADSTGTDAMACKPCHTWSVAAHGTVDLDMTLKLKLPIPTFLIPLALVRWLMPRLVRVRTPHPLALARPIYHAYMRMPDAHATCTHAHCACQMRMQKHMPHAMHTCSATCARARARARTCTCTHGTCTGLLPPAPSPQ